MTNSKLLFEEIERHLLQDDKPSVYINSISNPAFNTEYPFTMLGKLKATEQSAKYHPEGSVWNHTMLVVDEAAARKHSSSDIRAFMWAAVLHDIGKPATTKKRGEKITSYDHEKVGAKLSAEFLRCFNQSEDFISRVSALVRWHMQLLFVVKALSFADIEGMQAQVSVNDIALLGLCDRMGRLGADEQAEQENIRLFLQKCSQKI